MRFPKLPSRQALAIIFIDVLIIFALYANLEQYFSPPPSRPSPLPTPSGTRLRVAPEPPPIQFTPAELQAAITGLKLPTWSRGYLHCSDPQSEVTCSQVVRAWRLIGGWAEHMRQTPLENRRWVQARHYTDGVGNRLSIDTLLFLFAVMDNRSFVVKGFYLDSGRSDRRRGNAYEYDSAILDVNSTIEDLITENCVDPPYYLQVHDSFWDSDYSEALGTRRLMDLQQLIYSPLMYAQHQLSRYCIENFGMHAVYFLANYLLKISEDNFRPCQELVNSIPLNANLIGVHLRLQFPGQFYSYSVAQSMNIVGPFLRQKANDGPTLFGFASDSKDMESAFVKEFGESVLMTKAIRRPDFDHKSALTDLLFLEMATECLLSFRSTFSFAVAARRGVRNWFVDKEAPEVFELSNSQAGSVSMTMTAWDVNDWQTSRRFFVKSQNVDSMRYYLKYFML
jgi:hypothetical protein